MAGAGETYYIIVSGYYNEGGPYTLNITGTPYVQPNDQCPGTVIAALPYTDAGLHHLRRPRLQQLRRQ